MSALGTRVPAVRNCSTLQGSEPFSRGTRWGGGHEHAGCGMRAPSLPPRLRASPRTVGSPQPRELALTLISLGDLLGRKKAQEEKKPSYHVQQLRLPGRREADSFQMAQ